MFRMMIVVTMILSFVSIVHSQDTCELEMTAAVAIADQACSDLRKNQICYGNPTVEAVARAEVTDLVFDEVGDMAGVDKVQSMRLSALDTDTSMWGIALMNVAIPNAGEDGVHLVAFGDIAIIDQYEEPIEETLNFGGVTFSQSSSTQSSVPMQELTLETTLSINCPDVPDGILIQTPEGAGYVQMYLNEVMIDLGSTAYVAYDGYDMTVYMLEGEAYVAFLGRDVIVPAGAFVTVPTSETSLSEIMLIVEPYDLVDLQNLPFELLAQEIEIAEPLDTIDG